MKSRLGFVTILLLSFAALASAGPIVIDAGWYGFCFGVSGSPATAGCQNEATAGVSGNPTTFTAGGPVLFKITDSFQSGDSFDVYVDGSLSFTTPSVAAGFDLTDPDASYASPNFSHGFVLLGAGDHSVDVFAHDSPFEGGGGYLEVVSAGVPEPATLLLLGFGLAAVVTLRRRRT